MAVDLAKLSLWLATLAKDHPFTFLDHALKCGDSLVGLSKKQIEAFHWKPERQRDFSRAVIADRISRATNYRREIREAAEATPESLLSQKLALADEALSPLRFYGDLVIAAFFGGANDRQRKSLLDGSAEQLGAYLHNAHRLELRKPLDEARRAMLEGGKPVHPFHWEIEFPEVFDRQSPGFDAFVGNPPFTGGTIISTAKGKSYFDYLLDRNEQSGNRMDLVAYFFRQAYGLLRDKGTLGLIATNTIAQGDTRKGGLRWICSNGGTVYSATRRKKWPGQAAVVVSVVHVHKGMLPGPYLLDGCSVPVITAYLFHAGGHDDPENLLANSGKSYSGSKIYGQGFTFDDTDRDGVTSPIAEMHRLVAQHPRNAERIFPYIGGEELNDSPTHTHHRYVINFGEMSEEEARKWPDLMLIVEERIKPERERSSPEVRKCDWWRHFRSRPELYGAIRGMDRVLVCSMVSKHHCFTFVPSNVICSHNVCVFVIDAYAGFALLQSRVHEVWSSFFSSSLEDRQGYRPSDCFETFPFPRDFETNPALESAGRASYDFRAALMICNNEGLTKTYNRFHDPDERSPEILKLRELHAAMDWAALDAYGWTDLKPTCEFLLEYEEDGDEDESGGGRRRKKPWRYRWPDDFRDEVLARHLELNRQRAEQEHHSGAGAEECAAGSKKRRTRKATQPAGGQHLPGMEAETEEPS